ncbi:MAG: flippase [Nostoc sp. TH1S01]|nr:flippase [Nostoc sp. TH1S01]
MLNKLKFKKLSFFKSRKDLAAIIVNTGWLFADRILRMGGSLIVGVWVARYLGVHNYGLFNYSSAFVALFSPIASLGLDRLVVRSVVNDLSAKDNILGTTFWLKLIGAFLSSLLAIGLALLLNENQPQAFWLVVIFSSASMFQAFDTIDIWFQSQVQSKYTVIGKNTAFFLTILLRITLVITKSPLLSFAWASFAESAIGALGLVVLYNFKHHSLHSWRWKFAVAKSLLRESWPLIFSGLSIVVYMKIDQVMLGQMVGQEAVGVYSAAARMSEVWYFIPTTIVSSSAPAIYAAKKAANENLYYGRIKKLLRLLTLTSISIAIPMTFLSGKIITVLFGNSYTEAGTILSIHIWASLFVFLGVASGPWFLAEGLSHLSMYRTLAGAITNIVLNIILIPRYSGVGAAIATVISYAVGSCLLNATHPKTKKFFLLQVKSLFL